MYPTTRRNYTDEFKIQAVALAETLGRTEAARQLEMSVKTLDNWVNASRNGQPLSSPDRRPIRRLQTLFAWTVAPIQDTS
ncbi:transposase [Pseudomonas putida]|uniref:transposase n=1 Tax=Pseudomonas putida TaxID=303 RepID=UPI003CCA64A6